MAAQNFRWNEPKEEFHSIQPYRLIGVDRRRSRHTEREAERNEHCEGTGLFQSGGCAGLAMARQQHCVSM